ARRANASARSSAPADVISQLTIARPPNGASSCGSRKIEEPMTLPTTSDVSAQKPRPGRREPAVVSAATLTGAAPGAEVAVGPGTASAAIGVDQGSSFTGDDPLYVGERADRRALAGRGDELTRRADLRTHAASRKLVLCQLRRCGALQTARGRFAPVQ